MSDPDTGTLAGCSLVEQALFNALADAISESTGIDVTGDQVAVRLAGRHGIPSDSFFTAYDDEIAALWDRWEGR